MTARGRRQTNGGLVHLPDSVSYSVCKADRALTLVNVTLHRVPDGPVWFLPGIGFSEDGVVRGASSGRDHLASNSERGKPDCRMMPDNVPLLNSPWSGTGTVMVVSPTFFCMIMWLPFRRTSSKPWLDRILQTSLPERTRNLGILQPATFMASLGGIAGMMEVT